MPYIENGSAIGKDESRGYEYNAVTDRWNDYGPAVATPKSYSHEVVKEIDATAQRKREEEARAKQTAQYKEDQEASRISWILGSDERRETRSHEMRMRQIQEENKKFEAFREARERYKSRSVFYKITHKSPKKYNPMNMSVEQIDSLYTGRSR